MRKAKVDQGPLQAVEPVWIETAMQARAEHRESSAPHIQRMVRAALTRRGVSRPADMAAVEARLEGFDRLLALMPEFEELIEIDSCAVMMGLLEAVAGAPIERRSFGWCLDPYAFEALLRLTRVMRSWRREP